jgi:hypothetical protein
MLGFSSWQVGRGCEAFGKWIAFEILLLLMMIMMTRNKRVLPIRQHPHVADDLQYSN